MAAVVKESRDDVRRARDGGLDVPALIGRVGEHVAALMEQRRALGHGLEGVGHWLEHVVVDLDELSCRPGLGAGLGGHRGQHVTDVAGRLADRHELRPVVVDEPLVALAGHVGRGDDGDHAGRRLGRGRVDAANDGARMVGEAQRTVEHAGHDVIGHVLLQAQHLLARAVLGSRVADRGAGVRRRSRPAVPRGDHLLRWHR